MVLPYNGLCSCRSLDQESCSVSFNLWPFCGAKATKVIMSGKVMSGTRRLVTACPSVAGSIRWTVPAADEKYMRKTSTQIVASSLCWCVEPQFFSHLLLDWQKVEYLCSFLEAVPRMVVHHLLQLVVWLLLRLAAAGVVVVCGGGGGGGGGSGSVVLILLLHLKIVFNIDSLSTWFWVGVSNHNFTDGFLLVFDIFAAIAQHLQWSALLRFFSMTGHSCRNLMPWRYELLLQWQRNRSKAMMWLLYKFPAIWGYPRCFQ